MDNLIKTEEVNVPVPVIFQKGNVQHTGTSPMSLLELAVVNNASIDALEKIMLLKERWDKEQARIAFYTAMSLFQSKCPIIKRTKEGGRTKDGVVAYKYAPIEDMVEQTKELIGECGFSYTLDTPITLDDGVEIKIKVSHIAGHSEITTVKMPFVKENNLLSPPQMIGATMSYAKRYAFANAFGIITGEDDTDAITPNLLDELEDYCKELPKHVKASLMSAANTFTKKSFLNSWINTLPTENDIKTFRELISKVPTSKQDDLWIKFVNQGASTKQFLTNLNATVNKEKQ